MYYVIILNKYYDVWKWVHCNSYKAGFCSSHKEVLQPNYLYQQSDVMCDLLTLTNESYKH